MLDRFIQSLPPNLQYLVISVPGSFEGVTGGVAMMSASNTTDGGRSRYRGERVRHSQERPRQEADHASRNTPTAHHEPLPTVDDRFLSATCYYCSEKGHIARHCAKN